MPKSSVLGCLIIRLGGQRPFVKRPDSLRLAKVRDEEGYRELAFLASDKRTEAAAIAGSYEERLYIKPSSNS